MSHFAFSECKLRDELIPEGAQTKGQNVIGPGFIGLQR